MKRELIKISLFAPGSPERTAAEFLLYWQCKQWNKTVEKSQKSWIAEFAGKKHGINESWESLMLKTPQGWIEIVLGQKETLKAEIINVEMATPYFCKVTAKTTYRLSDAKKRKSIIVDAVIRFNVIKEDNQLHVTENGTWGVNPVSCLNEVKGI